MHVVKLQSMKSVGLVPRSHSEHDIRFTACDSEIHLSLLRVFTTSTPVNRSIAQNSFLNLPICLDCVTKYLCCVTIIC